MDNQDWETLENIKNDRTEMRFGNRATVDISDEEAKQRFAEARMNMNAKYCGHLNWKALRGL